MSHNLRQRIQRLEHVLHGPASKEEVQRQLADAFTTGTPPTDREAQRRYDAAREAFVVLGGGPTRFFPQDGEAIGRLFVIASEEEMEKAPHAPALNCPRCGDTAWMVRQDMTAAKAAYVKAGRTAEERAKRADDSFLAIKVQDRLPFDFHSLRVTAGTLLQEAGVPIGFVQKILNHKTLAMTLNNYNQPGLDTLHKLVAAAPPLATGTGPA